MKKCENLNVEVNGNLCENPELLSKDDKNKGKDEKRN